MKVEIEKITEQQEERVLIACYTVSKEVSEIVHFVKSRQENIEGYDESGVHAIPLSEIYYIETVDNKVFVYLKQNVYEIKMRLYEFEDLYEDKEFFRCSKDTIVNLMKIQFIKPALNSRFAAVLTNRESIIISRKYVPVLKQKLRGGRENE